MGHGEPVHDGHPNRRPGTVEAVAFTLGGGTLISGDSSHRIIAWDLDPAAVERDDA